MKKALNVSVLLDAHADPEIQDGNGRNVLCHAAEKGHVAVMRLLITAKCGVNIRGGQRQISPLQYAIDANSGPAVTLLLQANADPNSCDINGHSCLHIACENGHVDLISELLASGATSTVEQIRGKNPLHCAVAWKKAGTVEMLVAAKADVNQVDFLGKAPIHYCFRPEHPPDEYLLRELIACGADGTKAIQAPQNVENFMNAQIPEYSVDSVGQTAMHLMMTSRVTSSQVEKLLALLSPMPSLGCSNSLLLNQTDSAGRSPLFCSLSLPTFEVAETLVALRADVNLKEGPEKESVLLLALEKNLSFGLMGESKSLWRTILEAKADITVRSQANERFHSILHIILLSDTPDRLILDNLQYLLERKADVNAVNSGNQTPLMTAVIRGQINCVKLLLQHMEPAGMSVLDKMHGNTALHIAAYSGSHKLCRLLIEAKADMTIANMHGKKPMEGTIIDLTEIGDKNTHLN